MLFNGSAVVSYRPVNRVANIFRAKEQQATLEEVRRDQAAQDEIESQQLDHAMQAAAAAAMRAQKKYRAALKTVGQLLTERRAIEEDAARCEGQKFSELAAIAKAVAEHRHAMVVCMQELASELGASTAEVESLVAKDLERLEDETFDRRGLHARSQPRRDDGKFVGQE